MNSPLITFTRLLGAAAVSTLVAACSGGGGGGSSDGSVVPSDIFRITCTVVESVGGVEVPVDNASVIFNANSTSYNTQTDANGKCALNVAAVDAETASGVTLTFPAASVTKAGYEPNTILCANAKTGTSCDQKVVLVRITSNTSIPERGDEVMHIGDDVYRGEINSQFQKTSDGVSVDFRISDWGTKLASNPSWTKATVVLDAKGWQTTIAPVCNNTIAIVGDGGGSQVLPGGDSSADGQWTLFNAFVFDPALIGRSSPATLRITSGTCGGTPDIDDVETNRIRVYFCDAGTVGPCTRTP